MLRWDLGVEIEGEQPGGQPSQILASLRLFQKPNPTGAVHFLSMHGGSLQHYLCSLVMAVVLANPELEIMIPQAAYGHLQGPEFQLSKLWCNQLSGNNGRKHYKFH